MESAAEVQTLEKAICISLRANDLGKDMNSYVCGDLGINNKTWLQL